MGFGPYITKDNNRLRSSGRHSTLIKNNNRTYNFKQKHPDHMIGVLSI